MKLRWFNTQQNLNPLQKKALERAKRISVNYPHNTMFCPFCGSPLIKSGKQYPYETMLEHVCGDGTQQPSLKDEYICSNEEERKEIFRNEDALGCDYGIVNSWIDGIEAGSTYGNSYSRKLWDLQNKNEFYAKFRHNEMKMFSTALNTHNKKMTIEIRKEGLRDMVRLPSWLTFNLIQLILEFSYEANEWGEVKKTYISLGYLYNDGNDSDGFNTYGIWPWRTWSWLYCESKNALKLLKSDKVMSVDQRKQSLKQLFGICLNDSWQFRYYTKWMSLWHPKYFKELKKLP